jgi:glycosyltransferase involved in cell wall biosynthesis
MIKISLIIPCYHDSLTIKRAIDSAYSQTRKIDEVIVVNDFSPESDAIENELKNYTEIIYIKNGSNLGLAASRNVGLFAASGEIVTFLDADDQLHPQKIEFQLGLMQPNVAVACLTENIYEGTNTSSFTPINERLKVKLVVSNKKMLYRNTLVGASIMIYKQTLIKYGGYDESLRSAEDYDLWLRLLDEGVVVYNIQLELYRYYRSNTGSLSNNMRNISYWELEILKKHFQRKGHKFLNSTQDAFLWALWLGKHLYRFEKCNDEQLKIDTRNNIKLLHEHKILQAILHIIDALRLLKLFT